MSVFAKHFTLQEANALLPEMRAVLATVHALLQQIAEHQERANVTEKVVAGNGGGRDTSVYLGLLSKLQSAVSEITARSVLIKDLNRGLLDFPHIREGREVLLCWELGEPDEVRHWHDLESGYAGRQPL